MEEKKLSQIINLFEFVKNGMLQVDKNWNNFIELTNFYNKNKNLIIKFSNYRVIINESEYEIHNKPKPEEKPKLKMVLIAAIAEKNLIGIGPDIPWKLSNDMKLFKELTQNHVILMGRKTYETFRKPLPNRIHIVLSKRTFPENIPENVFFVNNLEIALDFINSLSCFGNNTENYVKDKFFVIGGGQIYEETIDLADELRITHVFTRTEFIEDEENKVFFPIIKQSDWKVSENLKNWADEKNQFNYNFTTYIRNKFVSETKFNHSLMKKLIINYFVNKIK
jgi:dihydrofolate reductase